MEWVGFLAASCELVGTVLLSERSRWGFISHLCGGILWITYSLITHSAFGLVMVCSVSIVLNLRGFIRWCKQ